MTNGKLVSYQSIVNRFYLNFKGLNYDLNDEECLEWLNDFMALTNSPIVLEIKQGIIEIEDGRGKLPCDLHLIIQTAIAQPGSLLEDIESGKATILPMRWATDHFHTRYHCDTQDYNCKCNFTYQVNSNYIFTSVDSGYAVMAYRAIPTDSDGYPMIPGDQSWVEAATWFIAHKVASILWQRDDMTNDKFAYYEREKEWYFAQAVNYSKIPSIDKMESFKNDRLKMITEINDHSNFFSHFQLPEQRHWRKNFDGS